MLLLLRWLHWWQRLLILLLSGFLRCLWGDGDFIVWNDVGHLPPYLFILGTVLTNLLFDDFGFSSRGGG